MSRADWRDVLTRDPPAVAPLQVVVLPIVDCLHRQRALRMRDYRRLVGFLYLLVPFVLVVGPLLWRVDGDRVLGFVLARGHGRLVNGGDCLLMSLVRLLFERVNIDPLQHQQGLVGIVFVAHALTNTSRNNSCYVG